MLTNFAVHRIMPFSPAYRPMIHTTTPYELIDIGVNLSHDSFDHDRAAVLADARAHGVVQMVLTGTSEDSSHQAAALAASHPGLLYSTAGVHPHEAERYGPGTASELRQLATLPQVVAIGETGLDFFRDFSPRPLQERAFAEQLQLAVETGLPVFLHQRDAHDHFHGILKEQRDQLGRAVVHCFTGTRDELFAYLDLDLYIGITGWVCDERRGQHLQELLKDIPADRLMLETDAPYLLPRTMHPKPKSRRNEPANLRFVLAQVALSRGEPIDEVARSTTANARVFFDL